MRTNDLNEETIELHEQSIDRRQIIEAIVRAKQVAWVN